jgi:hypothetical protein
VGDNNTELPLNIDITYYSNARCREIDEKLVLNIGGFEAWFTALLSTTTISRGIIIHALDNASIYSFLITKSPCLNGGTQWRIWLKHCATTRKIAGSIPDGAIDIFY